MKLKQSIEVVTVKLPTVNAILQGKKRYKFRQECGPTRIPVNLSKPILSVYAPINTESRSENFTNADRFMVVNQINT